MYEGSLSRPSAIGLTLDRAMPILIVAVGGIIATRAAMFNIGLEGQLMVGGLVGAVVALKLGLPAGAALPLTLVASAVGGALWAGIASLLRFWRGVDVVIRSEEHTSELQSLMRISYAVFCLKKQISLLS